MTICPMSPSIHRFPQGVCSGPWLAPPRGRRKDRATEMCARDLPSAERIEPLLSTKLGDDISVFLAVLTVESSYRAPNYISVLGSDHREEWLHAGVGAGGALYVD